MRIATIPIVWQGFFAAMAAAVCFLLPGAVMGIKENWRHWWAKLNESKTRRKRYELWYGEDFSPKKARKAFRKNVDSSKRR